MWVAGQRATHRPFTWTSPGKPSAWVILGEQIGGGVVDRSVGSEGDRWPPGGDYSGVEETAVTEEKIGAATVLEDACAVAAQALVGSAVRSIASVEVLLRGEDALHCYAVGGAWRLCYYVVPADAGAVGMALRSGTSAVDEPIDPSDWPYPVAPRARTVLCIPIPGPNNRPIGVLKVDLSEHDGLDALRTLGEAIAPTLGARLNELGYQERETSAERLVRHMLGLTTGTDVEALVKEALATAREISGLSTAAIIRMFAGEAPVLLTDPDDHTALTRRLRTLAPADLAEIMEISDQYGTWFTSGSPETPAVSVSQPLLAIGVRSLLAIPAGHGLVTQESPTQRVLLVVDERVRRPALAAVGLLRLLSAQAQLSYERVTLLSALREKVGRDPLTGIGNQATLSARMTRNVPGRTAVALIDVDNFKDINDTRGHAAGDQVLIDLADVLSNQLRSQDALFRVGGDEFVAVLEIESIEQAERIGDRLLDAARQVGCSVSVGIAIQTANETASDILRRADYAMYQGKQSGGDRLRTAVQR